MLMRALNVRSFLRLIKYGVGCVAAFFIVTTVAMAADDTAKLYEKTCAVCHDSGSLNAPKKGDKATWDKLISEKGMDKLVQATRLGMPQMPAKGLCNQCTDKEFRELIAYMAK